MTPLEVVSYLLEPPFVSVALITIALAIALTFDRIGGHND